MMDFSESMMEMKSLKFAALIFLSLAFATNLTIAGEDNEFPLNLLFSKDDVPRIRENTQLPLFKDYWDNLLEADFEKDENFFREAFIYAVTGDPEKGANARQGMLATLERKRWDIFVNAKGETMGFLTAGRLTAWMSLSYDWIYDLLSPEEREEVLRQIAEQGCLPCSRSLYGMRYPESVEGWAFDPEFTDHYPVSDMSRWPVILGNNNFRAVLSGGFALGLFALEGRDDRFDEWKEMLLHSIERSATLYGADGSYDEGMSYCNYANTYMVYFMEVMQRKTGIELFDLVNFVGVADCNLALFYPHHLEPSGSVNFGDAGPSLNSSNLFWTAGKSRDGLTQYQALKHPVRHDLFSLLYFDPSVNPVAPDESSYFSQLETGWITTRTGYGIDDLVVAMRSGPPANHEHADRNSIVLKYSGEVLLTDSKHPTYNAQSPEWLLRTSLAHNTITIDGRGHQYHNGEEGTNASQASAEIIRKGQRPGYVFWTSDATQAYALEDSGVNAVVRTVMVFGDIPFMLVMDKVTRKEGSSQVSARWLVENSDKEATIETDKQSFILHRPNARFFSVCAENQELEIRSSRLPMEESFGVFPLVDVGTVENSDDAFIILAGSPLKNSEEHPKIEITRNGHTYQVEVIKDSKYLKLNVYDHDRVPEVEIIEYR